MSHGSTHASDGHGAHDDGRVHAHISPFGFLVAIFAALIVLTLVTVKASYYDFGSANAVIAVFIATVKAALVALFFMHLKSDKPFHGFIFVMAFVFLGVFMLFCMEDLGTRGRLDDSAGVQIQPRSGDVAPGGLVTPGGPEGHGAAASAEHGAPAAH